MCVCVCVVGGAVGRTAEREADDEPRQPLDLCDPCVVLVAVTSTCTASSPPFFCPAGGDGDDELAGEGIAGDADGGAALAEEAPALGSDAAGVIRGEEDEEDEDELSPEQLAQRMRSDGIVLQVKQPAGAGGRSGGRGGGRSGAAGSGRGGGRSGRGGRSGAGRGRGK